MEEIFEIRSCTQILKNHIKIDTTDQYVMEGELKQTDITRNRQEEFYA